MDWLKVVLTAIKLYAKKNSVDPKYLEIKPRILSDANMLKGLAALRSVLSIIPPTAVASNLLGLGDVGFRIWKRIALQKGYDGLMIDPLGRNVLILKIKLNPVLTEQFGRLITEERWEELERVVDDFRFITSPNILRDKYPTIPSDYINDTCNQNKEVLGENLSALKQTLEEHRHIPTVDQNIRGAITALTGLFPAMRDWALFSSEGFDEVIEIIDEVV